MGHWLVLSQVEGLLRGDNQEAPGKGKSSADKGKDPRPQMVLTIGWGLCSGMESGFLSFLHCHSPNSPWGTWLLMFAQFLLESHPEGEWDVN